MVKHSDNPAYSLWFSRLREDKRNPFYCTIKNFCSRIFRLFLVSCVALFQNGQKIGLMFYLRNLYKMCLLIYSVFRLFENLCLLSTCTFDAALFGSCI